MAWSGWSSSDLAEVSATKLDQVVFASLAVQSWAWGYLSCLPAEVATAGAASWVDQVDVMGAKAENSWRDVVAVTEAVVVVAAVAAAAAAAVVVVVVVVAAAAPDVDMRMDGLDSSVDTGDIHTFLAVFETVAERSSGHVDHGSAMKLQKRENWIEEYDILGGMGAAYVRLPLNRGPLQFQVSAAHWQRANPCNQARLSSRVCKESYLKQNIGPTLRRRTGFDGRSRQLLKKVGRSVRAARMATDAEAVGRDLSSAETGRRLDAGVVLADAESLDAFGDEQCSKGADAVNAVELNLVDDDDGDDAGISHAVLAIVLLVN